MFVGGGEAGLVWIFFPSPVHYQSKIFPQTIKLFKWLFGVLSYLLKKIVEINKSSKFKTGY